MMHQEQDHVDKAMEMMGVQTCANETERRLVRQGSVSENFFAVKNASLILPKQSNFGESIERKKSQKFGGDLKIHLYAIFRLLRPQDNVKLVARLESWEEKRMRYLVIVTTVGRQDTEENIILGIDFPTDANRDCTIGLTVPIWNDTAIKLDGDGGLKVTGRDKTYIFKPVSVQAMWSALQAIHKCIDIAYYNNYYYGSLYLTWTCYYESRVTSARLFLNEWEYTDEIWSRRAYYFTEKDTKRESTELKIRGKLKEVMMQLDLDNCNSRDVREALEKVIDLDLKEYKTYIDTEMLTILGQMENASKMLDFLYLGSEWNASDMEELNEIGITHILNITMEVDNFFPGDFIYKNIRCYDVETTDLLHVWNDTWKFIKRAQRANGKCLVHCKMGISRSSATVTAFIMKENLWSVEKALSYVKERRPIIHPNNGFMHQLQEYEGILKASSQRHNLLFRSLSESNLSAEHGTSKKESHKESVCSDISTSQLPPPVDFHRWLLDLTHRHNHKRSKSWSPGEESQSNNDASLPDYYGETSTMNRSHMSEPQDLFSPSPISMGTNHASKGASGVANRRKNWQRRHTERVLMPHDFDMDTKTQAHSEDSVFVNPGVSPAHREDIWMPVVPVSESRKPKKVERMSSPAAIQTTRNELDIQAEVHSSLVSPMSSPSFKCTKNVNIAMLKSQFSDEQILMVEYPDNNSTFIQTEQSSMPSAETGHFIINDGRLNPDVTSTQIMEERDSKHLLPSESMCVKNLIGDIESRFHLQEQGEQAELCEDITHQCGEENISLSAPDDFVTNIEGSECPTTQQSFSDDEVPHVKNLIGNIESRFSKPIHEGRKADGVKKCTEEFCPEDTAEVSDASLLCFLPPYNSSQNLLQSSDAETSFSSLAYEEKNANLNNNNSIHTMGTVKEDYKSPDAPASDRVDTFSAVNAEPIRGRSFASSSKTHQKSTKSHQKLLSTRTLTQNELQVIREVGKTFLAETTTIDQPTRSTGLSASTTVNMDRQIDNPTFEKRGIVRKMARIIEDRMQQEAQQEKTRLHNMQSRNSLNLFLKGNDVVNEWSMNSMSTSLKNDVFLVDEYENSEVKLVASTNTTHSSGSCTCFKEHPVGGMAEELVFPTKASSERREASSSTCVSSTVKVDEDHNKGGFSKKGKMPPTSHQIRAPITFKKRIPEFHREWLSVRRSQSEGRFDQPLTSVIRSLRTPHYSQSNIQPAVIHRPSEPHYSQSNVKTAAISFSHADTTISDMKNNNGVKKIVKMMEASSSMQTEMDTPGLNYPPEYCGKCNCTDSSLYDQEDHTERDNFDRESFRYQTI